MKICVPINKKTFSSLYKNFLAAQKKADLIEIWFDEISKDLTDKELGKLFSRKKKAIIYKTTSLKNFEKILEYKPQFIDLDISADKKLIKKIKKFSKESSLILSYHNFTSTPPKSQLHSLSKKMQKRGADIIKIATFAKTFADSLLLLELLAELQSQDIKAICIGMGKKGILTRSAGHLLGNYLMFAPLRKADKTAPGQLILAELKKIQNLMNQ